MDDEFNIILIQLYIRASALAAGSRNDFSFQKKYFMQHATNTFSAPQPLPRRARHFIYAVLLIYY